MKTYRKGRDFELSIAKQIRESGLDKTAQRMARSGAIETLESDILTQLPLCLELKNREVWEPVAFYNQACRGAKQHELPVVVMKKKQQTPLALLSWDDLIHLMLYAKEGGWTRELSYSKRRQVTT